LARGQLGLNRYVMPMHTEYKGERYDLCRVEALYHRRDCPAPPGKRD
jgi:hypothetical protein